ncbi:glycoside hydrolase family 18 protein [Nonomuraea turcica]|uniref:hypothetical protein n=1 Tax=Nonomuraea sp. G32 TaxID=3067274 RepID=UPI00273AFDF7|nr:hypothetical protein [Nonomuraea sp. G32]MDP4508801.1 hypothetical protein [Nonomuraea sp. G32]
MPRHKREPGTLPRPLAILGGLGLAAATAVAIQLLPAGAAAPPLRTPPAVVEPSPSASPAVATERPAPFVGFVDTARDPGFDLPAQSRRTGVRHYMLGHLIAGGDDGCSPKWAGPLETPQPDADRSVPLETSEPGTDQGDPLETPDQYTSRSDPLDPGKNPVANKIGRLRALGGDAVPTFGGPGVEELAVTCTRPGGLAAAYRRVVGAFDAAAVDFEIRDSEDGAVALRRARAIRAMRRERPLRVSFTLPLRPYGLDAADVAMLRTTHEAGAEVGTVNLLAAMQPRSAPHGRLRRLAAAIQLAKDQIVRAQDLPDPGQAWRRIALTPVLAGEGDLSELDARTLAGYAARHGLAWLSLRGVPPSRDVTRILRGP